MNTQPILIPIIGKEDGDRWLLTGYWDGKKNIDGNWLYKFTDAGNVYTLTVPQLFDKLDGASVPRFLRSLVRMGGREMPDEAWLPHDFLYYYKGKPPSGSLTAKVNGNPQEVLYVTRKFVDKMLHRELRREEHGLASFKAPLAYLGVRAAFWKNWSK